MGNRKIKREKYSFLGNVHLQSGLDSVAESDSRDRQVIQNVCGKGRLLTLPYQAPSLVNRYCAKTVWWNILKDLMTRDPRTSALSIPSEGADY